MAISQQTIDNTTKNVLNRFQCYVLSHDINNLVQWLKDSVITGINVCVCVPI